MFKFLTIITAKPKVVVWGKWILHFLISPVSCSGKLINPKGRRFWQLLTYNLLVRSTGDNLDFRLAPDMGLRRRTV